MKYTWWEFSRDVDKLEEKLKDKGFKSMVIITRGGLFLGGMLAERLNIRMIDTFCIDLYGIDNKPNGLSIIKQSGLDYKNCLIVDDIVDSGVTLGYVSNRLQSPSAVLFYKPRAKIKPTYYIRETDNWISFPWEV